MGQPPRSANTLGDKQCGINVGNEVQVACAVGSDAHILQGKDVYGCCFIDGRIVGEDLALPVSDVEIIDLRFDPIPPGYEQMSSVVVPFQGMISSEQPR